MNAMTSHNLPGRILDWVALIERLDVGDRESLREHFLSLDADDRRLRFGLPVSDSHIDEYVDHIDFAEAHVYGVRGAPQGPWIGIGHLIPAQDMAELGLSVVPDARGKGLGAAIFRYAVGHAASNGATRLYMHFLASNRAILSIARSAGMSIGSSGGESDAYLIIPSRAELVRQLMLEPAAA